MDRQDLSRWEPVSGPYRRTLVAVDFSETSRLAVGARGHSSLDRFLIGSVAEAVVGAARCDVLVVRSAEDSSR